MLVIGSARCRKFFPISIDITSNAPTATSRPCIFGPEARPSLLRRRVSTVVGSFSSCRTSGGNRKRRRASATELCSGRSKRGWVIRSNYFVRQRTFASSSSYRQTLRPAIRLKSERDTNPANLSAKGQAPWPPFSVLTTTETFLR